MNEKHRTYLYDRLCDYLEWMQFKTKEDWNGIESVFYNSWFSDCIEKMDQFIAEKMNEKK